MKIVSRKTALKNQGNTRTMQHFDRLLGQAVDKMGIMATLYPNLTTSALIDRLCNRFMNKKGGSSLQPINEMVVEWDIDVNFIKTVKIAKDVAGSEIGKNIAPFNIYFDEKFYSKNDSIVLKDRTQLLIIAPPRMHNSRLWEYTAVLITNSYDDYVDSAVLKKGQETRFQSNYQPEMSTRGYTKYLSNTETHRNYISRHRNGDSFSGDYARREKYYIEQASKNKEGKKVKSYYEMHNYEKDVMDSFMESRNNSLLFAHTNFTAEGKCLHQDENGADIPIGEGVLPQIERYCNKFMYSTLSIKHFERIIQAMGVQADSPQGNTYAVVCNEPLYYDIQRILRADVRFRNDSPGFMYSKGASGKVRVGAEYDSYTFGGNTIIFMPDRTITQEFPDGGFGFFLDLGADMKSGRPNLSTVTVEGMDLIQETFLGMGGKDGKTSNVNAAITTHGCRYEVLGYDGAVVFAPYKAFILKENV